MKLSSVIAILSSASACTAIPFRTWRRQTLSQMTDPDILRYALTLEHLEDKFYREGLANFTAADFAAAGFDSTFYANLQQISKDETTHVAFLTSALEAANEPVVAECTYAFGITSPSAFVATASILEGVGVSAYLGAAAQIMSKGYLTAAGSILTIEARHSSYLRAALAKLPFPQPFDAPLSPDEVFSLAWAFVVSCPASNPALPLKPFPALALATAGPVQSGDSITREAGVVLAPKDASAHLYAAFASVTGPVFATLTPGADALSWKVLVPQGVNGQSYVVLTKCNETVTDDTVVAGPALVEVTN
ncbi:hypothetical protein B0A49_04739 [Cryomyces minteri]|uniref:Protein rds1 n=1 Tax=Cryomyces minteri TaxID=331657 RepID=A0A4U0X7E7_9PEZI|nr:hypothetical protein B0A49_04739 [Cryomyces minteri]